MKLGMIIGAIAGFVFSSMIGLDIGYALLFAACFAFSGYLIEVGIMKKLQPEHCDMYATYDGSKCCLILHESSHEISKFVKVRPISADEYSYKPPQIVYTGATVGGVTTGGFHMEEGKLFKHRGKTDKYELIYLLDYMAEMPVKRIKLTTDKMIKSAKQHPVLSRYLKGDTLELINEDADGEKYSQFAVAATQAGQIDVAANARKLAELEKLLSKEECNSVLSFLTG